MNWESYVRKVVPYVPGEQPKRKDIIKLNTNENPYPPAPKVRKIYEEFDLDQLRKYPDPNVDKLREAIAEFHGRKKQEVFVGVGSDDVLAMIFMTFFNCDEPILFPDITYSFYEVWAKMLRIPYKVQPLDENFQIQKEDYNQKNGGIIFPNPNAPTGVLMGLSEIEEILSHNPDSIVVVDEAYIDFGGISAVPLIEKYENLLVVQTFSKSRSLAGLRIGYAIGCEKLIRYINDVKYSFNSYTMNQLTIELGTAAIEDREYFEKTIEKVIATREKTKTALKELGFSFQDSKSNFIFARHERVPAEKIFEALKEAGIYVRHFSSERIHDYLRISIGTEEEMAKMIAFLKDYLE